MIVAELLGVVFEEESIEVLDHTKKIDELVLYQGLAKDLSCEHAVMRMEVSEIFSTPGGIHIWVRGGERDGA